MGFPFGYGNCLSPFWANPCLANAYVPTQVFGCGVPMSFPGFYDSSINRDMLDAENGHWNIKPNLMMETANTNALMFQVRNLKFNQYSAHPYFGDFCSSNWNWDAIAQKYLSSMPTIQQWMQANPWQPNSNITNNNGIVGVNSNSSDPKEIELGKILGTLQAIRAKVSSKEISISTDAQAKLNKAFETKGTVEERLANAKAAIAELAKDESGKNMIRKVLLLDSEIVNMLTNSGYEMSSEPYSLHKTDDATESEERQSAIKAIEDLKSSSSDTTRYAALQAAVLGNNLNKDVVLRRLSYLNDAAKGEGKSFIQLLIDAPKKNASDKENAQWLQSFTAISTALYDKGIAVSTKSGIDADTKKKIEDAYKDFTTKKNAYVDSGYDGAKGDEFVKSFNNLYAISRQVEAQLAQNKVREKFGHLNGAVSDLINDDLIVKETKADLDSEKLGSYTTVNVDKMRTKIEINESGNAGGASGGDNQPVAPQTPAGELTALKDAGNLDSVSGEEGIYKIKDVNNKEQRYYTVIDGKIYKFFKLEDAKKKDTTKGKEITKAQIEEFTEIAQELKKACDEDKFCLKSDAKGKNFYINENGSKIIFIKNGEFHKVDLKQKGWTFNRNTKKFESNSGTVTLDKMDEKNIEKASKSDIE